MIRRCRRLRPTAVYSVADERHEHDEHEATRADRDLEHGIDPQRVRDRQVPERASHRLPTHMPPMNVPSSTPIETVDEPTTSCSIWNQTIS